MIHAAEGMRYVMGTFLSVRVQASDTNAAGLARERIFDKVQRLEELLSKYRPASDVSKINQAAGIAPVRVSQETYRVIDQALAFARLTAGAFDPTAYSGCKNGPAHKDVLMNSKDRTVFLSVPGMRLDLGGIGKGFALDCALEEVRAIPSMASLWMDFGGQLLVWAQGGSFNPLPIAIEDPQDRNAILETFDLRNNASISTSSDAEQPGHVIDVRLGRPARRLTSATVVAPTGTLAEVLSTAFFVLGMSESQVLLKNYPDVRAYLFEANRQKKAEIPV